MKEAIEANLINTISALIGQRELRELRDILISLTPPDIAELMEDINIEDAIVIFRVLPRELAADIFEFLPTDTQTQLLNSMGSRRVAILLNEMAADDRTTLFEEIPAAAAKQLLNLLSKEERGVALSLLGYPESSIGRLMTPDYVAIRGEWTIAAVLDYIREHGRESDSINVVYVTDERGALIGELRIRAVLLANPQSVVSDVMSDKNMALSAYDDQETAVQAFKKYGRTVLPVVDSTGLLIGMVTVDDVLDVAEEEATEDIQKFGGTEALTDPYIRAPFPTLIRNRARWLVILFVGEMLTASAMAVFQTEIEKAVVLALFVPLIISSGGNSGSQAATLVIRALSLREITLQDWWKVLRRELGAGLWLGGILGAIGFFRIVIWSQFANTYGPHWFLLAMAISASLLAVVMWGTVSGAMLPLILKRFGADPATSSAPFVATLVDVIGLVIYFSIAAMLLKGTLL